LKEIDTIVRVRVDSKFYTSSPHGPGRVIGMKPEDPGFVVVSFPKESEGYRNRYRYGDPLYYDGVSDLELDECENQNFAVISFGGQTIEVCVDCLKAEPGDTLKLTRDKLQAVAVESAIPSGGLAFVAEILNPEYCIVDSSGGRRTVSSGKFGHELETNGKVILDASASVIIKNYGLEDDTFEVAEATGVTWDDICGQDDAKKKLKSALEDAMLFPEHYSFFKKKPPAGVLLFGPPGCSKTMFAKALYTSLVEMCKKKGVGAEGGFILISGPELLDKYLGVPEAKVRHIFAKARKFFKRTGMRAIIVFDECEAVLRKRESGISSDFLATLVPAIIAEMQGVRNSGAIVLLLTNKPDMLDYAAVRDGRIDELIPIGRPDKLAVEQIFIKSLKDIPVSGTTTIDKLSSVASGGLFDPAKVIYQIHRYAKDNKDQQEVVNFTMADIVSGAMIPNIVEKAKGLAFDREKQKTVPTEGVREEDIIQAVKDTFVQNFGMSNTEALSDRIKDFKDEITGIEKVKQAQI
jgi:SpoVK/Ycf46/Vps4 family AAA+-type ATPase